MDDFEQDLAAIKRHYVERFLPTNKWSALINPHPYLCQRQRHRRLREALVACGWGDAERLRGLTALDVGCGSGSNLAWLVELGAEPANLTGVDLVEQRIEVARARFSGMRFLAGDFLQADVGGPFDLVMLLAVLTSVTNPELKRRIARRALDLVKPGGVFFFYDLVTRRPARGTSDYQCLTFDELDALVAPRKLRYFRRDLLKSDVAERLIARFGVPVAEIVQASGLFNLDATFAYLQA